MIVTSEKSEAKVMHEFGGFAEVGAFLLKETQLEFTTNCLLLKVIIKVH